MEGMSNLYDIKRGPETKNTSYEPRRYLGANVGEFCLPGSIITACFMSGEDYFNEAVNTVYARLSEAGGKLGGKIDSVMRTRFCLELYVITVLKNDQKKLI